jgi:hypothetical protein
MPLDQQQRKSHQHQDDDERAHTPSVALLVADVTGWCFPFPSGHRRDGWRFPWNIAGVCASLRTYRALKEAHAALAMSAE